MKIVLLLLLIIVLLILVYIYNKYELFEDKYDISKEKIINKDSYNVQIEQLDSKCNQLINNISLSQNKNNFNILNKLNTNIISNSVYNVNNNLKLDYINTLFKNINNNIEKLYNYELYKDPDKQINISSSKF